jgi:hypothetical protein
MNAPGFVEALVAGPVSGGAGLERSKRGFVLGGRTPPMTVSSGDSRPVTLYRLDSAGSKLW